MGLVYKRIINPPIQRLTETPTDLQEAQSVDEQFLESEAIKQQPLSHDISRISLHRSQAKLTVDAPDDHFCKHRTR